MSKQIASVCVAVKTDADCNARNMTKQTAGVTETLQINQAAMHKAQTLACTPPPISAPSCVSMCATGRIHPHDAGGGPTLNLHDFHHINSNDYMHSSVRVSIE